jgi:hypothetical protein
MSVLRASNRCASAASLALVVLGLGACLYDSGDVCGPNQVLSALGVCECVAGAAPAEDGAGCTMCGENEVPTGTACTCIDGYARLAAGEPCAALPAGLGEPCDSEGAPCADATYSLCHAIEATTGYCTSADCETSDDCPSGYACSDEEGGGTYCQRPPTGQSVPCDSAQDCAGYDASYCETIQGHVCLVSGCTQSPGSCFEGWGCCDLSSFGLEETLCVPEGQCPTD